MQNPSEQRDLGAIDKGQVRLFLANWELLEELVSEVYSKGQVDPPDRDLFGSLKLALKRYYIALADELRPFWRQVRVAGRKLKQDPFVELLDVPGLSAFITNWEVIEKVPAAREALNLMLLSGNRL
jgi:hypothetical protein